MNVALYHHRRYLWSRLDDLIERVLKWNLNGSLVEKLDSVEIGEII